MEATIKPSKAIKQLLVDFKYLSKEIGSLDAVIALLELANCYREQDARQ